MSEGDAAERRSARRILVFSDGQSLVDWLIKEWHEIAHDALQRKGYFVVALSGGKTPENFYRGLAEHKGMVPWDKTHIFLVDERFVPDTADDSNYRMIRDGLLGGIPVPAKNVHAISTACPGPTVSAKKYEEDLAGFFALSSGELPEFDLIMLGIGKDGHTASLFPGSAALSETGRLATAVLLDQGKHDRITLTLPVINNARNIIFLATGKEKAEAVRDVIGKRDPRLPASLIMPDRGKLFVLADSGAAMLLSEREYEKG